MLSIHRLSAGDGFRYLLRHTASHDVDRAAGTSLTSYYAGSGYPPGRWLGAGLSGFAGGQLAPGDEVAEAQMANLYGRGLDPVTGEALGRAYRVYRSRAARVADRVADLDGDLSAEQRAAAVARIEAEEGRRRTPNAVAGFDLTFSPVKSVSALWAIAAEHEQAQIVAAHHEALADMVALMEREVAFTRTGAGGVAQLDTQGLVAAAFDHWDSRAGDPQLHTHLVVANRVQGPDGRWRTLDGRMLYAATVALSETYNDLLADNLTARLGVGWEHRERGRDRAPGFEIAGIPAALLEEFSARTAQIEHHLADLVAEHREETGREPSRAERYVLAQQATLCQRPHKDTPRPLSELVAGWRHRAERVLHRDPRRVVQAAVDRSRARPLTAAEVDEATVAGYAATVVLAVQTQRATWNRWNILAEAARQTRSLRLATAADRIGVLDKVADQALGESVSLSAPDLVEVPDGLRRADGASVFTVHRVDRYTSATILGAEAYLLDRAATTDAPAATGAACERALDGATLGEEQAEAVRRVAGSGRGVEALVGAAGAGKTTTLRALRQAWEADHGPGSVRGLAPSATAAEALAVSLGVPTENTAKWLYESVGAGAQRRHERIRRGGVANSFAGAAAGFRHAGLGGATATAAGEKDRWQLDAGELLIVDEASLAGTLDLATLARQAHEAGAKLLLVGDDAQLSAVDAGGAFRLLARETDAAELTAVRRFDQGWEGAASLRLRRGDRSVLGQYAEHRRISDGDQADMVDAAYHAWLADTRAGHSSLLLAADTDTVRGLNQRARLERIQDGEVEPAGVALHDGSHAGVGDQVVTRQNARRLVDDTGRSVRNGTTWTVTERWTDGSLTAQREDGTLTLPPTYVARSLELAYAATVHRSQGVTADTTHLIARAGMSREALYVGLTRGRHANHAYVITHDEPPEDHQAEPEQTVEEVLSGILAQTGVERSATEIIREQLDQASSLARLVPMYEHIAQAAQADHWRHRLTDAGLDPDQLSAVLQSPAWPALVAGLRQAQAHGLDADRMLADSVAWAGFDGAHDTAAVLHARLDLRTRAALNNGEGNAAATVAGVITPIHDLKNVDDSTMAAALTQTQCLIAQRAHELAERAIAEQPTWITRIGPMPGPGAAREHWQHAVTTIAAYRERHSITTPDPVGPEPTGRDHWYARDHAIATHAVNFTRGAARVPATVPAAIKSQATVVESDGLRL